MNRLLIVVGILVILVGLVGAIYFYQQNSSNETNESSTPQTTVNPEEEQVIRKTVEITLTQNGFEPNEITIENGTKVVWINSSGKAATVDSNPHPIHTSFPEMNLGSFNDGEELELIFSEKGEYNYHNHFSSEMGGKITVE